MWTHRDTAAWGSGCSKNSIRITKFLDKEGSSLETAGQGKRGQYPDAGVFAAIPVHSQARGWVVVEPIQNLRTQLSEVLVQVLALQLDVQLHYHLRRTRPVCFQNWDHSRPVEKLLDSDYQNWQWAVRKESQRSKVFSCN